MTSMQRISLAPAWILHRYPYRDSSLLLEVFTREHGRLGLVARGARAARSRWSGRLQILCPLALSWQQRGDLGTLTGAESRRAGTAVGGRALFSACYLNELLLRLLTRHDPQPRLFDVYEHSIALLADDEERALRGFEMHLLQELGYGLLLDREADSGTPVEAGALYEYRLERGPERCEAAAGDGLFLHGSSLLALHHGLPFDARTGRELKTLMRAVLAIYLGASPLKTRQVLRQLAVLEGMPRGGPGAGGLPGQSPAGEL